MEQTTTITPAVLKWARKSLNYSKEDVVEHLKIKRVTEETVAQWEKGQSEPSYPQLKKLAKFYKRPVALFFFPEVPEENPVEKDFRSLPVDLAQETPPKILWLVRKAKVRQMDLEELHSGIESKPRIFDLIIQNEKKPIELARQMREWLKVPINQQIDWSDTDHALKNWREKIETLGVWIFKDSFKNDNYCGFCIYDKKFPIIYINNNQPKERQIFTLFHELGHIIKGKTGIDFRTAPELTGHYQKEEVFCNAFAGNLLLPSDEFENYRSLPEESKIRELSKKYKVSYDVVLRKFLDKGLLSNEDYKQRIDQKEEKFSKSSGNKGGGNYYRTQLAYLGNKYTDLVFKQYYNQRISQYQLADYLGMKVSSLSYFEGVL